MHGRGPGVPQFLGPLAVHMNTCRSLLPSPSKADGGEAIETPTARYRSPLFPYSTPSLPRQNDAQGSFD